MAEPFLDDADWERFEPLDQFNLDAQWEEVPVDKFLQALETLRTHLRKKYYRG